MSAIRGRLFLAAVLSVTISLLVSLAVTTDLIFDLGLGLDFTESLALAGVLSLSSLGVVGFAISEQSDGGAEGAPALDLLRVVIVVCQILAFAVATWFISTRILPKVIALLHASAIDKGIFSLMLLIMFGYILLIPMGMTYALRKLRRVNVVNGAQPVLPSLVRFALDGLRVRDVLDTGQGIRSTR